MTTAFPYPPRHVVPSSRVPVSHLPKPSDNMKRQDPQQRLVGNTRSRLELLQQQYQQKLLREREAKMIEIYEKNQDTALKRVNRQTSLRDFFKERRSLEATRGGAVPSIQQHYKNKVKQQGQLGHKSKQPVWNPGRTRRGPELERKPWSGINRGNPLQPIQRQAISADDRYRQPDPDGHYETSDDLTSNHSSNPPSDLEDEDTEFKFVPKPPVQQRPGKVRQTRRTMKQDISRKDMKQISPEDDGYYSNQQEDGGYSGNPAREDDQPPPNFAKAKLLGKIKQKERDRIASREGTFYSDHGRKEDPVEQEDRPSDSERRQESKNKRDDLKQQEVELMALLKQRQQELENLKQENEEAERREEERKRREAQCRRKQQEERQRREEEERKRLEEEEQRRQEEEEEEDEQNSNRDGEDEQNSWYQNTETEEQNFNATYTLKFKQDQAKHEKPKKVHQSQVQDTPIQKEAEPNEDLAFFIDAAEASEEVNLDLRPCPNCGRRFTVERLAKHQKACSSMKKRKVMDPSKMRTQGTEMEKYSDPRDKRPEPTSKKADWRKKREDFIQAIRYAKKVSEVEKKGGRVADLPPPPRSENPDYKQCPHCQRKFNQTAAERHIPKCKEIKSRPPPMKRR